MSSSRRFYRECEQYLVGRCFGCRRWHALTVTSTQQSDPRVYAGARGGIDFSRFEDLEAMSVTQLVFALKAFTFEQKRLDRLGKRLSKR